MDVCLVVLADFRQSLRKIANKHRVTNELRVILR